MCAFVVMKSAGERDILPVQDRRGRLSSTGWLDHFTAVVFVRKKSRRKNHALGAAEQVAILQ